MQLVPQEFQLLRAEVRRRAAAEIDKLQFAVLNSAASADEFDFLGQSEDITLDRVGVLIRIDAEITEPATLAAEGNVQIEAHRHRPVRLGVERGEYLRHLL